MNTIQLIRKLRNEEMKLGTKIEVYYSGMYVADIVYNGNELIYDENKLDNSMFFREHYSFKIKENNILDKKEKKWLSRFIEPFKNDVLVIRKIETFDKEYECLSITTKAYEKDSFTSVLPYFKKNSMYKGMELDKKYTVEELGLCE